jgi:ubiquinone/menaquinone biosynthesis C-methylase UbiE
MSQKSHWEKVYGAKQLSEVSWYQPTPQVSLDFVKELDIPKDAAIIDVGGGDSFFADHLLSQGYTNITVLDISGSAIARAKKRLGEKAAGITWIVSDILEFVPSKTYDFWHDRATFHFLTGEDEVSAYLSVVNKALTVSGKMVIGTFSETGPEKCSGLPVKQYNEQSLTSLIKKWFRKIKCIHTDHITPFNTLQNFLFCSFQKSLL